MYYVGTKGKPMLPSGRVSGLDDAADNQAVQPAKRTDKPTEEKGSSKAKNASYNEWNAGFSSTNRECCSGRATPTLVRLASRGVRARSLPRGKVACVRLPWDDFLP